MQISSAMRFSILKQKKNRKTLMMKEEEGEGRNHGIWQEKKSAYACRALDFISLKSFI